MKRILNWRRLALYALFIGCFYAFLMMCDETDNSISEALVIRLEALILMFACGYPLCRLTRKWEREGKI